MPNQLPEDSPYTSNGKRVQHQDNPLNGKSLNSTSSNVASSSDSDDDKLQSFQQQTRRVLLMLLAIGLAIGTLLSVGVIGAMHRLNLLDNQPQIEQRE